MRFFFFLLSFSIYEKKIDGVVSAMWTSLLYRAKTSLLYMHTHIYIHQPISFDITRKMIKWPVGRSVVSFKLYWKEVFSKGEWMFRLFSLSPHHAVVIHSSGQFDDQYWFIMYVLIARVRQVAFSLSLHIYIYKCWLRTDRMRTWKNI
jgi:hypothetical protein